MRIKSLAGALTLFAMGACGADPQFGLPPQQSAKFAELPGRICILVANNQDRWKLELAKGELKLNASCNERSPAPAGAAPSQTEALPLLPKQRELDYRGPWAISGDKKLVAASVARASDNRFVENQFLIVDALSKEVTARVERKSGAFLLTMSWSPTSRLLAVVYGQEQLGRCGSVLGSLSGHPARCTTFAIEVFDAKGSSVGAAEFARGIPGGGAVVAWQEM